MLVIWMVGVFKDNHYAINNFWQTRDLRDTQMNLESINESKTAAEAAQAKTEPLLNESYLSRFNSKNEIQIR